MLRRIGWIGLLLLGLLCKSCLGPAEELTKIEPLSVPAALPAISFPSDNEYSVLKAALGKRLFFDKALSIDSTIACSSCHLPAFAFADSAALSRGVNGQFGERNAPSLANIAYAPHLNHDGAIDALEKQAITPIETEHEMAFNLQEAALRFGADEFYQSLSLEAFDRPFDPYVLTRALGNYQRTLLSGNAIYDLEKLTEEQIDGKALFYGKAKCGTCHKSSLFTNFELKNNGLFENYSDEGRFLITRDSSDIGKFKVPSLRNVELTAPYMHDGSIKSLEEVIEHYNLGGKNHPNKDAAILPLGLTEEEKQLILLFLKTLTDQSFIDTHTEE